MKDTHQWGGYYTDQGVSGSIPLAERPAGESLCQDLRGGDAVIFSRLDRAFRVTVDACAWIDDWHRLGVSIHILDLNLDTSTPTGTFIAQILAALGQFERRLIGARITEALARMRREGRATNSKTPWGYTKVVDYTVKRKDGRPGQKFVPNIQERLMMADLIEYRMVRRWPWRRIISAILEERWPNMRGKAWTLRRASLALQGASRLVAAGINLRDANPTS